MSLTPEQQNVMGQAISILGEHFDHVLIATTTDVENDPEKETTFVVWRGGNITALGLADLAKIKITQVLATPTINQH